MDVLVSNVHNSYEHTQHSTQNDCYYY